MSTASQLVFDFYHFNNLLFSFSRFGANYHITPTIENTVTYFPFNANPYGLANGTNVYFSVAAGSFVQKQESEER